MNHDLAKENHGCFKNKRKTRQEAGKGGNMNEISIWLHLKGHAFDGMPKQKQRRDWI